MSRARLRTKMILLIKKQISATHLYEKKFRKKFSIENADKLIFFKVINYQD